MNDVLLYQHADQPSLRQLLNKYKLNIELVENEQIPGSYWGDTEAGIIKNTVFVKNDTPVHSIMHESCHYICMDQTRRKDLDTNAEGGYDEENAVCYLQILLADYIKHYSQNQMCLDMDKWGYTFRLGSALAWFEEDADDALNWLITRNIINQKKKITWLLNSRS